MARFRLPAGACSFSVGGLERPLDAEGCVIVDDVYREQCLLAGCVEVGMRSSDESASEVRADTASEVGAEQTGDEGDAKSRRRR